MNRHYLLALGVCNALLPTLHGQTRPAGAAYAYVSKATGKQVASLRTNPTPQESRPVPPFLTVAEKIKFLKTIDIPWGGTGTTLNLSVRSPHQAVNGVQASMGANNARGITLPWGSYDGAYILKKETSYYTNGTHSVVMIKLFPAPNKAYLIDCPTFVAAGTFYVTMQIDDNLSIQQTVQSQSFNGHLLILYPGTAQPSKAMIFITAQEDGSPAWAWHRCQITEL